MQQILIRYEDGLTAKILNIPKAYYYPVAL